MEFHSLKFIQVNCGLLICHIGFLFNLYQHIEYSTVLVAESCMRKCRNCVKILEFGNADKHTIIAVTI